MPRQIYHKPVRELLRDMLAEWKLQPGQVFTSQRAVDWFADRYPKLRHTGIRAHLTLAVEESTYWRSTEAAVLSLLNSRFRKATTGLWGN